MSAKKKKKKTKKPLLLEDDEAPAAAPAAAAAAPPAEDDGGDDDVDFGKKKKKKKKKAEFDADAAGDEEAAAAEEPNAAAAAAAEAPAFAEGSDDFNVDDYAFVLPLKKKRKRAKVPEEFSENASIEIGVADDVDGGGAGSAVQGPADDAWVGVTRDYLYTELLERVFDIMREKNPSMVSGDKRKFVMKPPQVIRLGSKKSGFINFIEICKMMHRQPDHLLGYLLAELGTSGTLDGSSALVLKGRFQQKQMESVLRRYIREYVTCHTCKSPDTILAKENRIFFLTCETCGARQSVTSIKAGFSAVVGKRSRIRAKENA